MSPDPTTTHESPNKPNTPPQPQGGAPDAAQANHGSTEKTKPETADAPSTAAAAPSTKRKKRTTVGSVIFDTILVLLLLGALGYSAYYLKEELPKFRVPSPTELALEENAELSKRYDELVSQSHHAEIQLAMRQKLAALDSKLASLTEQLKQGESRIAELKTQALGVQHEIRQADREARKVALSLLPGLQLGDVSTTSGKRFVNATVYRIENSPRGRRVVLRSPEGQVAYLLKDLVRDTLPQIFLYAFGYIDLVDMSDFAKADNETATEAPQSEAPQKPQAKTQTAPKQKNSRRVILVNGRAYEAGSGSPVVDTEAATKGQQDTYEEAVPISDEIWTAPDGALPM